MDKKIKRKQKHQHNKQHQHNNNNNNDNIDDYFNDNTPSTTTTTTTTQPLPTLLDAITDKSILPHKLQSFLTTNTNPILKDILPYLIITPLLTIALLLLGHFYCAIFTLLITIQIYKELLEIPKFKHNNDHPKYFYPISWYLFALAIYYLYINTLKQKLLHYMQYTLIYYLLHYHSFLCFILYAAGIFAFLHSLTNGNYRYHFRQLAYIHVVLLMLGVCSMLIINNIFNGLIWFMLPVQLIIINQIATKVCDDLFGKFKLANRKTSPQTLEGFVIGLIITLVLCFVLSEIMVRFDIMLCPVQHVNVLPFTSFNVQCDVNAFRKVYSYGLFGIKEIHYHTYFFGIVIGLVVPFKGVFAKMLKKAIRIKEYNEVEDRKGLVDVLDCYLLIGMFCFVWVGQFMMVKEGKDVEEALKMVKRLKDADKVKVMDYLKMVLGDG